MEPTVNAICLLILTLISLWAYGALIGSIVPKYIIKVRCSVKKSNDRGIKKYTFPSGRGVVYEPHPSFRKYVKRYVLFTHNGYKYFKGLFDINVMKLNYSIVMFNNKNEVIDVISVNERIHDNLATKSVPIHQDTSYVSFILNSVNDVTFDQRSLFYRSFMDVIIYAITVMLLSFSEFAIVLQCLKTFDTWIIKSGFVQGVSLLSFIIPSLIIGGISGGLLYCRNLSKELR
jgi:hypothetical protein